MPSENVQDGLPSYQRVYSLRRMAAAVIRSMPRTARQAEIRATHAARRAEAGRKPRAETSKPDASDTNAPASRARPTTETPREPRALPAARTGRTTRPLCPAERLREQLRRPGSAWH